MTNHTEASIHTELGQIEFEQIKELPIEVAGHLVNEILSTTNIGKLNLDRPTLKKMHDIVKEFAPEELRESTCQNISLLMQIAYNPYESENPAYPTNL